MAEDSNHALQRINSIQNPIKAPQKNYEENLPMIVEYQCYHKYIIRQCTIWNSYFSLILMIEGYNILYFREKINKTDDDFLAYLENTTIRYLMEPIEESDEYKYYFFCENMNASKNMTKLYKFILSEVEYGKLLPLDKKNEVDPCNVLLKAVKTYVNYIAENPNEQRTNEQEKILWEIMEKMGFVDDRCPC
ncbi:MAG: hypothetical protein PUD20_07660 [bacterium]|nr:hypothetical protein [bacterium]